MSPIGDLLKLATKIGPGALVAVRWAWPHIKDNKAAQEHVGNLLTRLHSAKNGGTAREAMQRETAALREEAVASAARSNDTADKKRAEDWIRRLDDIEPKVRLLTYTEGFARRKYSRRLRRELASLKNEMFAAAIGVGAEELPRGVDLDDSSAAVEGAPTLGDAGLEPETR